MRNVFKFLENPEIPVTNILVTGFFSLILRNFFESFSQHSMNYFNLQPGLFILSILHTLLFYLLIAISFIIVIHYATRERIESISRVIFSGMILLILAPLIDLVLSGGNGYDMLYFQPGSGDLFKNFISYSAFHQSAIGIKINCHIFLCFCYLRIKGKDIALSLAYVLIPYSLVFSSATPSILMVALTQSGFAYQMSMAMINYFSLLFPLLLWLWLANKPVMKQLLAGYTFSQIIFIR